jgi:hypothetical protein
MAELRLFRRKFFQRLSRWLVAAAVGPVLAGSGAAVAQERDAHAEAVATLADIDVAIRELSAASNLMAHSETPYRQAARRATNALVGADAPDFDASAGNPGDSAGALGHLDWLVARAGNNVWEPALRGAHFNLKVAKASLDQAARADGLEEFWSQASNALQALLVAAGRESTLGTLGGLHGALATTQLGVAANAATVSGCSLPTQAPAYGVAGGYLIYVAVPAGVTTELPVSIGAKTITVADGTIVLRTAASDLIDRLCSAGPPKSGQDSTQRHQ